MKYFTTIIEKHSCCLQTGLEGINKKYHFMFEKHLQDLVLHHSGRNSTTADGSVENYYSLFYIYAFSRRFYPKQLTLHSSYSFYI